MIGTQYGTETSSSADRSLLLAEKMTNHPFFILNSATIEHNKVLDRANKQGSNQVPVTGNAEIARKLHEAKQLKGLQGSTSHKA